MRASSPLSAPPARRPTPTPYPPAQRRTRRRGRGASTRGGIASSQQRTVKAGGQPGRAKANAKANPSRPRPWRGTYPREMEMENLTLPCAVRHKGTGELLVAKERFSANQHHGSGFICSPIDNDCSSRGYPDDEIEAAPPRKPGAFDYKTEIIPRVQGALPWEHVEPANFFSTLSNIAACGAWAAYPGIAWVTKPGERRKSWARVFLHFTQGGGYTGEAHALVWENGPRQYPRHLQEAVIKAACDAVHDAKAPRGDLAAAVLEMEAVKSLEMGPALPTTWYLAICKHDIVDSSTPEGRSRGWHPSHCRKCGINLSVDSSD